MYPSWFWSTFLVTYCGYWYLLQDNSRLRCLRSRYDVHDLVDTMASISRCRYSKGDVLSMWSPLLGFFISVMLDRGRAQDTWRFTRLPPISETFTFHISTDLYHRMPWRHGTEQNYGHRWRRNPGKCYLIYHIVIRFWHQWMFNMIIMLAAICYLANKLHFCYCWAIIICK